MTIADATGYQRRSRQPNVPIILVLVGVSGAGKTTVGRIVAGVLACRFYDADDFHPLSNIRKMRSGLPLTDEDREAWLDRLQTLLGQIEARGESAVLACSALKVAYRRKLALGLHSVRFVLLRVGRKELRQRLGRRRNHFMPPALLESQLADLEDPPEGVAVDAHGDPAQVAFQVLRELSLEDG